MESGAEKKWGLELKQELNALSECVTFPYAILSLMENLNKNYPRPVIPLGHGDPAAISCFRKVTVVKSAVVDSIRLQLLFHSIWSSPYSKIAETAKKLGIMVIADKVYDHLAFGNIPYVQMGVFGSILSIITLRSISKRWIVPGWRLGWLVTSDPNGIIQKSEIVGSIEACLITRAGPPTLIQVYHSNT